MFDNEKISNFMTIKLGKELPEYPKFIDGIRRAPKRELTLSKDEIELALKNALRYVDESLHEVLAEEFLDELLTHGRIYAYRFRPEGEIKAKPVNEYKGKCLAAKAIQLMIDNNLDFDVALYPYELVTYGETGQVCQNWLQYRLIKKYLENMTDEQTLAVMSGHPLGLFKSHKEAPRTVMTNSLMIGMYDNQEMWHKSAALGVANYGQMTAGGWMYIGPQGIVHGTFNTLVNAGRKFYKIPQDEDLGGMLYVTSGLGGMSGAQGKAVKIAGGVGIVAEVDFSRIKTRLDQGWIDEYYDDPALCFEVAKKYSDKKEARAIAYHGNVITLLEYAVSKGIRIPLLSDQTSCHVPYTGGYCPHTLTFEERTEMLAKDKNKFIKLVDESLIKHYELIKKLVENGSYFFDYGNSFMKAIFDAGVVEITKNKKDETNGFIWPSYVEDIMGPMLFDYGYGPFRWVCLSNDPEDLKKTDAAAADVIDPDRRGQDRDNYIWVKDAMKNNLVVGSQARILYQDALGRRDIALRFNEMVRKGEIGPIMLGRDHHDTGGTDSPFRETSNIKDGSMVMAEMAIQCFAGNTARGMTMAALHNGGGVGIGKSINGGFGLVLDGSERVDKILYRAIPWDVMVGVSRRSWARNEHAIETTMEYNQISDENHITIPFVADDKLIKNIVDKKVK